MFAECLICLESLGGERVPIAMPCGHLYCLDCATFWFNQADSKKCALCGKSHRGEDMIRLWLSSGEASSVGGSRSSTQAQYGGPGAEALEACKTALASLGRDEIGADDAVMAALSRTQLLADEMDDASRAPGILNLLKDLRHMLSELRLALDSRPQPGPSQPAQPDLVAAKAKLERQNQRLLRHAVASEQAFTNHKTESQQREASLQQRVTDLLKALNIARRNLDDQRKEINGLERDRAALREEKEDATKSEMRYKKKYHALKQEQGRAKKKVRTGYAATADEDSLVVLPPS